jgi:hypothetical protein
MEHRAWKSVAFEYPQAVPTMLQHEETQYLYWLGSSVWKGRGLVLEIGPWLGGSTVCLAAGMRASGHDVKNRLHAVDNFLWREFMAARADLPLQPGDSFEPYFLKNLSDHADIVVAHALMLPDEIIEGDHEATAKRGAEEEMEEMEEAPGAGPVEILFIDGAKSWRGMAHLLRNVRDRLEPGQTLFVCQDFKYWGTYWVPMMMSRLRGCIEPVHNVLGATTVTFRLAREIPRVLIDSLEDHVAHIPTGDGLTLIDNAQAMLAADGDPLGAANVSLCRVSFLAHQGHTNMAVATFRDAQAHWPARIPAGQLERARTYLREEKKRAVSRPLRLRIAKKLLAARHAMGSPD